MIESAQRNKKLLFNDKKMRTFQAICCDGLTKV